MFYLAISSFGSLAGAMDSTQVLPESVNSPSVRMGIVSGIGMRFMSSGDLMNLGDVNSIEFDSKTLMQFEPRAKQLVNALNQFGHQKLGDQLSLGILRVETAPEVRYLAPIYARGITAHWTVGFGIPVVTYKNRLSLRQVGSNVDAIQAQIGNASQEVNKAFQELSLDLGARAQSVLVGKGYKPLVDRDETQMGDVQLVSLWRLNTTQESKDEPARLERWSAQLKTIVSLPTGKGNDPDDLADLGAFGYSAIENQILGNYILNGRWTFALRGGYRYTFSDRVERRVPHDETDTLPDQTTKETVDRHTGGAVFVGGSVTYSVTEKLDFAAGWESTRKASDVYNGEKNTRYDLLGRDTNASADRVRLGLTYSTVETFLAGRSLLPAMIAYEFSDTFRGSNTERMTIHEIWLQLFF